MGQRLFNARLELIGALDRTMAMDGALLYEPPFTGYAPQGPDALFSSAQVEKLFGVLSEVRANALAA